MEGFGDEMSGLGSNSYRPTLHSLYSSLGREASGVSGTLSGAGCVIDTAVTEKGYRVRCVDRDSKQSGGCFIWTQ